MSLSPVKINIELDPQPVGSQTTAIPLIAQLMNPACVLITQFRNDGFVVLYGNVLSGGKYTLYPLLTLPSGTDLITFEFGVDVGTDPLAPLSGLVVQRADEWVLPWDDEISFVLGGKPFPFGFDPVQITGSTNPVVAPMAKLGGEFAGPSTGGSSSELKIIGLSRTTITKIDPLQGGMPSSVSLSLWLPAGTDGYLRISRGTKESHRYSAEGIIEQVNAGVLEPVEMEEDEDKAPGPVKRG